MTSQKEKLFYDKLKDIFIGAKIEGDSGFINLMRIKSAYFDILFSELQKEVQDKVKDFPDFKEELFDKLHTFFKVYFSESGSIYFSYTPLKSKIYDKIYSSNKDVVLFWKTNMLYYVKTDKLWNNLTVDFDENSVKYKIHFEVSKLEHKKANEKRNIIYELKSIKEKELTFSVIYSEKGRITKVGDILKEFKKKSIHLDEERLERIFRIFEKQNEVDYFINKDAEKFLKEQFELWIKDYILDEKSIFNENRLKQLKVLKDIAYKVIDFVAQFEDELVKIWNKPKFVLNSNYVITFDKIAEKENGIKLIEKLSVSRGIEKQFVEWKELGILDKFDSKRLFKTILNGKNTKKEYENSKKLNEEYQHLPIDTKYFSEEIKFELLSLFNDLDKELDGWMIHSENYQALKTILPKFKEKVQTCYIDPPFNLGTNADFLYNVNYKDSSWITLLENRLNLTRDLLNDKGSIFVRCDYNGNMFVRMLMNSIFNEENFRNEITIGRTAGKKKTGLSLSSTKDSIFFYSKKEDLILNETTKNTYEYLFYNEIKKNLKNIKNLQEIDEIIKNNIFWVELDHRPGERLTNKSRKLLGIEFEPPKGRHWIKSQEKLDELYKNGKARIRDKNNNNVYYSLAEISKNKPNKDNLIIEIFLDSEIITDNWTDTPGYSQTWGFQTENSEELLKRIINTSSTESLIILDFFLGIGTTVATAHKTKRKWIGIEVGEHFFPYKSNKGISGVIIRMKEVLSGTGNHEPCGISKEINWKGGGFFKYYDLEQYEQTLKKVVYKPSHPFLDLKDKSIYQQYVFMKDLKLLNAVKLNYERDKIEINFDAIYSNIDLAETLSNITGKWIKKIAKECVEFEDGEKIEFDKIDFNLIKALIWW